MAYVGNTVTTQGFTPAVDYFSGNASTTAFTLSKPVASVAQVQAVIENVPQNPNSAYTVSGNTITFTSAPPSGTNNIYVYYTSPITQVIQPSQGTVGAAQLDTANSNGTGALQLPSGTTAQRPASPVNGQTRYNSTLGYPEWYNSASSAWLPLTSTGAYSVDYLVVAGGAGGGGSYGGGGGGAGGYVASTSTVTSLNPYTITVGAGGAAGTDSGATTDGGSNGSNSIFGSIATATGGGGGGADAGLLAGRGPGDPDAMGGCHGKQPEPVPRRGSARGAG